MIGLAACTLVLVVRQVGSIRAVRSQTVLGEIGWGLGDGSACSYLDPTYSGVTDWGGVRVMEKPDSPLNTRRTGDC